MISESTVAVYIEIFDAETSDTYDIDMGGGALAMQGPENHRSFLDRRKCRNSKMTDRMSTCENDRPVIK